MYSNGAKPRKFHAIKQPIALTRRKDLRFFKHVCCEECSTLERSLIGENPTKFKITDDALLMVGESPFMVPLYLEYKRKNDEPNDCGYMTPCGVELYDYASIYRYLKTTKSRLNVNQFVLTARIELFRDHQAFKVYAMRKDISNGLEATPIQAINEYKSELPEFTYIKQWRVSVGSELIENNEVCGCSCEDDCSDADKCECRQLTVKENRPFRSDDKAGYEFNYLFKLPETAIYECNTNCKCKKNCLNRVVQNGIKVRLQVYRTSNRGYGVRCLHDIPKGTFICAYEGEVVKNLRSPSDDKNHYILNLDYYDCYRQLKSQAESQDESSSERKREEENGDKNKEKTDEKADRNEEKSARIKIPTDELADLDDYDYSSSDTSFSDLTNSDLSDSSSSESDSIEQERNSSGQCGEDKMDKLETDSEEDAQDDDQEEANGSEYMIDSSVFSNVARFLNHSCNSNLRCQPVYIESRNPVLTHMAFFAIRDIKAFTELTINYFIPDVLENIDFGCLCKSKQCVRRTKIAANKSST